MKKVINKMSDWWKKVCYYFSRQRCYDEMEDLGIAVFDMCSGKTGGVKETNYLNFDCIGCPFYTNISDKGDEND